MTSALLSLVCVAQAVLPSEDHDFVFGPSAVREEDGLLLGNGGLAARVWWDGSQLVLDVDHPALWDERPTEAFDGTEFRDTLLSGPADAAFTRLDQPFRDAPAPTRLPAGRITLQLQPGFAPESARLSLAQAELQLDDPWQGIETFVDATRPVGRLRLHGSGPVDVRLDGPPFQLDEAAASRDALDPRRLDYRMPELQRGEQESWFAQELWSGRYVLAARWQSFSGSRWELAWTVAIADDEDDGDPLETARRHLNEAFNSDFDLDRRRHREWWRDYWSQSGLRLPDRESALEARWYRDLYLYGSAARRGTPPLTPLGPWCGERDRLPRDKGRYHHASTPRLYEFSLAANRPDGLRGLADWVRSNTAVARDYTRRFHGSQVGINLPASQSLSGHPMGGWPAHAFSLTAGCQVARLLAKADDYFAGSEDERRRTFGLVRDLLLFVTSQLAPDATGALHLPHSSSPELFDGTAKAHLASSSNHDLSLIHSTLGEAARMADALGEVDQAQQWRDAQQRLAPLAFGSRDELLVATGVPLPYSHRVFGHLAAIHPHGSLRSQRDDARRRLERSLEVLDGHGVSGWIGTSFAERATLAARAHDPETALACLDVFIEAFTLPNGLHAGGDQSERGLTRRTDRAPSLDGNTACADALQTLLFLGDGPAIEVLPAAPRSWSELSFSSFRARGGFLVSARRSEGRLRLVRIESTRGGPCRVRNPFSGDCILASDTTGVTLAFQRDGPHLQWDTKPGQSYVLRPAE